MSRNVSQQMRLAAYALRTNQALLTLMELDRPGWPNKERLVNSKTDKTHKGNLFKSFPFKVVWPRDSDETLPQLKWQTTNIDRSLLARMREDVAPIDCRVMLVLSGSVSTIEMEVQGTMPGAGYDSEYISGTITVQPIFSGPVSKDNFDAVKFPGLFR